MCERRKTPFEMVNCTVRFWARRMSGPGLAGGLGGGPGGWATGGFEAVWLGDLRDRGFAHAFVHGFVGEAVGFLVAAAQGMAHFEAVESSSRAAGLLVEHYPRFESRTREAILDPPRRVPHGVTLIGRLFDEGTLAEAGLALERAFGVVNEHPPGRQRTSAGFLIVPASHHCVLRFYLGLFTVLGQVCGCDRLAEIPPLRLHRNAGRD